MEFHENLAHAQTVYTRPSFFSSWEKRASGGPVDEVAMRLHLKNKNANWLLMHQDPAIQVACLQTKTLIWGVSAIAEKNLSNQFSMCSQLVALMTLYHNLQIIQVVCAAVFHLPQALPLAAVFLPSADC